MAEQYVQEQEKEIDNLLAGNHPPVLMSATIVEETVGAKVGTLEKNTVLGRITTDDEAVRVGKLRKYDADNTDGSGNAVAILANPVIASAATSCSALVYVHGEFNRDALVGIDTAGEIDLQSAGIYVKEVN